jgi:hypothetical protein
MSSIELEVDEDLLRRARQHAAEHDTTLEALLVEHLAILADRAGRRLTLREQIYVDYRPPEEVIKARRSGGSGNKEKDSPA